MNKLPKGWGFQIAASSCCQERYWEEGTDGSTDNSLVYKLERPP